MFVQEGSVECHLRLQHNAVCIFHIIGNTRLVFTDNSNRTNKCDNSSINFIEYTIAVIGNGAFRLQSLQERRIISQRNSRLKRFVLVHRIPCMLFCDITTGFS